MLGLILETSRKEAVLLLQKESVLLACRPLGGGMTQRLFVEIEALLKEQGLTLSDLDFVAAGEGPGSYTGTRIGAMAAMGLGRPLYAYPSALAYLPQIEGAFVYLMESKQKLWYLMKGRLTEGRVSHLETHFPLKAKELEPHLEGISHIVREDAPLNPQPLIHFLAGAQPVNALKPLYLTYPPGIN